MEFVILSLFSSIRWNLRRNPNVASASDVPNIKIEILEIHDKTRRDLCWCALCDEWDTMRPIVEKDPNSVRIPLTRLGDTALHVAAIAGSTYFVEEFVELMRPEDVLIHNSDEMLPVHLAALSSHHIIVQLLCSDLLLDKMAYKDIEKLFFMTINNNMFDEAITLFEKSPLDLTVARDEQQQTSLHILVRKSYEVLDRKLQSDISAAGMNLLKKIWTEVKKLEREDITALTTTPSVVLFDALESGNEDYAIWCFREGSGILRTLKDSDGRNILHLLFLYRRMKSFHEFPHDREQHLVKAVDNEGNNVLHLAALLPLEFKTFSGFSAKIQMQKELAWFKDAETKVPHELRSMKNKEGKKPIDVFYDEHKKLSDDIKKSAKGIVNSGMVVATLVATVAFAAALTNPGSKKNDWFVVFFITNAIALFSSSASIVSFLSNFTSSRFAESEFVISLHPSLTFGFALLIISVAAMVVAFSAASFLIFEDTSKWVSYVVASMGVFPLLLFPLFQFSFFDDLIWSRWYHPKLE